MHTIRSASLGLLATALAGALLAQAARADAPIAPAAGAHPVDLVIALDVSGSMRGLIESAKQRLWDVVNELDRARPQPDLRVAVLSYGNPAYGERDGFVRVDVPLTRDLDAVNEALFGFSTNGGAEYVARVIARATATLQWSPDPQALRVMFVAGNESAHQDPDLRIEQVMADAIDAGIVINTVFCGSDSPTGIPQQWRRVAVSGSGRYASIDQQASTVAAMETPFDATLRDLNTRLNATYLPYGPHGGKRRESQLEQDRNAARMSAPAVASRAITKAGRAYVGADWDLVDALDSGVDVQALEPESLPAEMRDMAPDQRVQFVQERSRERQAIKDRIRSLARSRRDHVEREQAAAPASPGLAEALKGGLRSAAESKGFTFE